MPDSKPLKIIHVVLSRGFAGSERSTSESCNVQSQDHEVHLVIRRDHRKNGKSILDHISAKVIVHQINARLFTKYQLERYISKVRADVIHCHLRRSTRLIAKLDSSAVTVSTLHIEVNGPHFLKMDGLICNAKWQVEKIPNDYRGLVFKASNSLVPHRKISELECAALRADLNCTHNDYLVGAIGRYHTSKAWDTLIKAFMQTSDSDARLLFFGTGSLESELRGMAKADQRIRFIGYRSDIKDIYQCLDLMVCPSRYEPLPRVMLEGYDAGLPMIASDVGGCKELIDEYGGECFAVDNVNELSGLLSKAINDKKSKNFPDLSAHYIENANAGIVGFYRQLIARN